MTIASCVTRKSEQTIKIKEGREPSQQLLPSSAGNAEALGVAGSRGRAAPEAEHLLGRGRRDVFEKWFQGALVAQPYNN